MINLPDLRGVFVRGQDNSKGYHAGRALGTYQQDTYVSHSHAIYDSGSISLSGTSTRSSNGNHIHTTSLAAASYLDLLHLGVGL